MRKLDSRPESWTNLGLQRRVLKTGIRLLRLAAMSCLFGVFAGTTALVYAQTADTTLVSAADIAPAQAGGTATNSSAIAQPQPEQPIYEVLPGELMPTGPSVAVVAQSSVPPEASPQAAAGTAAGGKKGKKKKKEKAPKLTPVHIQQATLTVDGWTGKARLNYDIADLKYIYVWAPGIGTIVASNQKFPLGVEQKNAFNGNMLTVQANGHQVQISSETKLLKDKKPASAWVYLDSVYKAHSVFPEMGYGSTKDAPYSWPGAKQTPVEKGGMVPPPPLPAGMRPMIAKPTCLPAGAASTTGIKPASAACPVAPAKPAVPPSAPAAAPPVPLPGYSSGITTAQVVPAASKAGGQ
jgi:hypothetical protein